MNALRVVLAIVAAFALFACAETPKTYQGWVEANLIFVAPDETGRVETLSVREGERVEKGVPLFTVDEDIQRADLRMNEALVENAQQAFDRAKLLLKTQAGTQRNYDDAEAALRTAQARLNSAQTRLVRRKLFSPVTGAVQQIYFRPGEMTPAGRPVLALLPPGNLKLRFFVPEAVLPQIAYGELVKVHCDGCADDITARVSFISRTAEFTPPVIYSLQERSKLVFMIEALPDNPEKLRVGQPIDVALEGTANAPVQAAQKEAEPFQGRTDKETDKEGDKGVRSWLRNWALSLLGAENKTPGHRE